MNDQMIMGATSMATIYTGSQASWWANSKYAAMDKGITASMDNKTVNRVENSNPRFTGMVAHPSRSSPFRSSMSFTISRIQVSMKAKQECMNFSYRDRQ